MSITTCFINKEVRIEFVLSFCEIVRKIKCMRSIRCISKCIESDYIRQLRFSYYENRTYSKSGISIFNNGTSGMNTPIRRPLSTPANLAVIKNFNNENNETLIVPEKDESDKINKESLNPKLSTASANTSITSSSSKRTCCFNMLVDTEHNDFHYQTNTKNKPSLKKKEKKVNESKFNDVQNNVPNDDSTSENLNGNNNKVIKLLYQKKTLTNDINLENIVIHESEDFNYDKINNNHKKFNSQNYGEAQHLMIKSSNDQNFQISIETDSKLDNKKSPVFF